jgi:hypothetical protein
MSVLNSKIDPNDRLLPGFQELIHRREDTTFAASLKKREQAGIGWFDPSKVESQRLIESMLERHKQEVKEILKENLSRIKTFDDNS